MNTITILWLYFILLLYITSQTKKYLPFLFVGIFIVFLELFSNFYNIEKSLLDILEIILIILSFLLQNKNNFKTLLLVEIPFLSILLVSKLGYKIFIFQNILDKEFLKFISVFLLFKRYKGYLDFIYWILLTSLIFISSLFEVETYKNILSLGITFYYTKEIIDNFLRKLELEKSRYRNLLNRAIDFEIQEGINKVDDKLKITYKKLKEIFKLSSKVIKPIEIDEIIKNVIDGLLNLGFKGVAVIFNDKDKKVFIKEGFIPNIAYLKDIDINSVDNFKVLLDNKIVILPIKKDNKNIGLVFVYKKSKVSTDEIEYLQTYINAVSTAIAKTLYFKEKEELERNLFQAEKHAVLGKLSAGISHNLKNPLAVITSSAFALKKKIEKGELDKALKFVEKIEKSSKRAEEILNKLLDYAKPSFYSKERVNLKEIILNVVEFIKSSIKGKNIDIILNLDNLYIEGDKNFLEQALVNILLNSVEAIQNNGKIEINLKKDKNYIVLKIKDNGSGIPKEILKDIFEPYFTTKINGTGLGLAISKRIIEEHNGTIELKSKEGEGTEFIIKFKS